VTGENIKISIGNKYVFSYFIVTTYRHIEYRIGLCMHYQAKPYISVQDKNKKTTRVKMKLYFSYFEIFYCYC